MQKRHKKIVIGASIAATTIATLLLLFTVSQYKAMAATTDQVAKVSAEVDALYSDETHTMLAEDATEEQVDAIQKDITKLEDSEDHSEESAKMLEEATVELDNAELMIDLRDSANALFKDGILIQGSDIATVEAKATELNEIKPKFVASIIPTINEAKNQKSAIDNATKLVNSLFTAEDRKEIRDDVTREEYQAALEAVELVKDPAIKEQLQGSLKVVDDELLAEEEAKRKAEEEEARKKKEAEAAAVAAAEAEAKKKAKELEAKEVEKEDPNEDDTMGGGSSGDNGPVVDDDGNTDIYPVPKWGKYNGHDVLIEDSGEMFGDGAEVYKVIDVSQYQEEIDWEEVAASGVDGVIIRATSYAGGDIHEDDYFWENYQGAKSVGLPVGVYVYSYAESPEEAAYEAQVLLDILQGHGIKPSDLQYGVYFDIEDDCQEWMTPAQYEDMAQGFFGTIENAGYTNNAIYSGKSYAERHLKTPYLKSKVGWVARYNDVFEYDYTYSNSKYLGWQYTSTSTIPGVDGNCDVNGFYKNPSPNLVSVSPSSTEEELILYPTKWECTSKYGI